MSMNRYSNLTKQRRVIAPNVSPLFPFDTNATKKKKFPQHELDCEQHGTYVNTNVATRNQKSTTISMGELIHSKKGSNNGLFNQKLANRNSSTSGARRKLVLVDNDDDMHDDEISPAYMEYDGFKDGENEVDNIRSQGDVVQDYENEDIDKIVVENIRNEMEGDDSEDDLEDDGLENEDDELVEEQFESIQLEKKASTRKRGPTMMHGVHLRKPNEREIIICNEFAQSIGPKTEEKDTVGQFSQFLGTIARNYDNAPLTYSSWHKVPGKEKDKMWEYVLEKYIVPDDARDWVLMSIGASWRGYKCRLKKKHFYQYKDNKTRWANRPKNIPEKEFIKLLSYWNKKDVMNECLLKRNACKTQEYAHCWPKNFARIREEMMNENPNREQPTSSQMFERTRKRKIGNVYCETYDDTANKIEQMKNYRVPKDESALVDPFVAIMGKEYDGHCRLYGKGVTKKLLKKVNGGSTSYMVPGDLMESLKASVEAEKKQLADMRKELKEEYEKEKAELEAIRKDIDNKMQKLMENMRTQALETL